MKREQLAVAAHTYPTRPGRGAGVGKSELNLTHKKKPQNKMRSR